VSSMSDNDVDLQKLWIALQRKAWRVLAVVPTTRELSSLAAANVLAEVAWRYHGDPTIVLDLRDVGLRLVEYQQKEIASHVEQGNAVILALSPISLNAAAIPLARGADAAVLLVRYGVTPLAAAEHAIEEIGHDKFSGTLVVKPAAAKPAEAPAKKAEATAEPAPAPAATPKPGGEVES
jgi:hypothetical protein